MHRRAQGLNPPDWDLLNRFGRRMYRGMTNLPELKLIEALKQVDAHGDVAPPHVQDPTTMVIRQLAVQADLMRWDGDRGRFVLTSTGRSRISKRASSTGTVLRFRSREKDGSSARQKV
ncbi:hypothetical protein SAMN05443249_0564 [Beijerinckia sp. 28-YEA-48]|nr:hypothetical protein SAMN05443249_0564 [Beijerinckia sp. 28-YEA-48]